MESAPAHATAGSHTPSGATLVLTIIGAAVLSGIGIMGMIYWLVTFRWILFLSVIPVVLGAYLLFTRATGPDHA